MYRRAMTESENPPGGFSPVREVAQAFPPALVHPEWARAFPWLVQGTTTRGLEDPPFDLGLFSDGSPEEDVRRRWWSFREALGVPAVHARQEHGALVRVHQAVPDPDGGIEPGTPYLAEPCDGHVTAEPGLLLTVSIADCVPVFLVDPVRRSVGAVHAGWRGAASGVLEQGLQALAATGGSHPRDLHVHFGPAICGTCYEVGPEVFGALGEPEPSGPTPIDLRGVLARRAVVAGVSRERISISTHCTRCTSSDLFSHRAGDRQRQVGYVGIRPEAVRRPIDPLVGLCSICRHHRVTGNRRGSTFHLCERSRGDPRFRRYPPLPIIRCPGFEPGATDHEDSA